MAVGDRPASRALCSIDPDVQSGDLDEKWRQFGLRNIFIHARKVPKKVVLRIFITLKNPSPSVGIEPANVGSSGEHANH
jgi:hypothetical protein